MGCCKIATLIISIAFVAFVWVYVLKDPHYEVPEKVFKDYYWGKKVLKGKSLKKV